MDSQNILMLSAILLTLVLPAILLMRFSDRPPIRRDLMLLAGGMILQIVGEGILLSLGKRSWLPYWEAPLVGGRFIQLAVLFSQGTRLDQRRRALLLMVIIANFALWIEVGMRLLQRF